MLSRILMGCCVGTMVHSHRSTAHAIDGPMIDAVMDPSKDVQPVNCVVVGGGYAGGKIAYQLDSIFNVTLVDTKNYEEITSDIIPIITAPWSEKNDEACKRLHVLHRYYLKRANVLTGVAEEVRDGAVVLADGRTIPYDILAVATGERKSFPFETTQKTVSGRVAELKAFNKLVGTWKKVAIVGGGPMGVTLAASLAEDRPGLCVHLFHSQDTLLPKLPQLAGEYATDVLAKKDSVTLHLCSRVVNLVPSYDAPKKRHWYDCLVGTVDSRPISSYDVQVEKLEYQPRPLQSIVSQMYFGKQPQPRESRVAAVETIHEFDYVFNVAGDVPRPISTNETCLLASHVAPDGHYKASCLLQLFGHPNVFAVGRCNNLPWCKGLGSSDLQARTLFRMLNAIINSSQAKTLQASDGLRMDRLAVPRMLVKLGNQDACGSTPWSGGMVGVNALREFIQDRGHVQREFTSPVFYKQQELSKVRTRIMNWMKDEITDITDFSHV